ncbi:MAG: 50S ribosomal protein L6 [Pseudomonadota bacterium]|nr:50S ribosomal protein L6 [Pseudomonadota bacterium]
MSRVAKSPIKVPAGVQVNINANMINIKGSKGTLERTIHPYVSIDHTDNVLKFTSNKLDAGMAQAGTMRALVNNMVNGVSSGFKKELTLIGVGYRAAMQGTSLKLTLGFSHEVLYPVPQGITIDTPSQTEIIVSGVDKQQVGQVAADIRSYRPPEPYKGKGVRYKDEVVVKKEGKKQ